MYDHPLSKAVRHERGDGASDCAPRSVIVRWSPVRPLDLVPLAAADRIRWLSYQRLIDRHRFAVGRALLAHVAAALVGDTAGLRWSVQCARCSSNRHGPVEATHVSGVRIELSLSHSADRVVAVGSIDPVRLGVDVEPLDARSPDTTTLPDLVLAPAERAVFDTADPGEPDACIRAWWVRKESVLKAARVGLTVDPSKVVVNPPSAEPRLVSDPAAIGLRAPTLYKLEDPGLHSYACLCVDAGPAQVSFARVDLVDNIGAG